MFLSRAACEAMVMRLRWLAVVRTAGKMEHARLVERLMLLVAHVERDDHANDSSMKNRNRS